MDTEAVKATRRHEPALFIAPNTLKDRQENKMRGISSARKTSTSGKERKKLEGSDKGPQDPGRERKM